MSYAETENTGTQNRGCEMRAPRGGKIFAPQKIGRKTVGMPSEGNAKAKTRVGNTFRRWQKLHNIPAGAGRGV